MSTGMTMEWWRPETRLMTRGGTPVLETNDSRMAFGALMLFLFILLISPQSTFPALAPLRIAFLTAVFAVVAHVLGRLQRNRPVLEPGREMVIAMLLVAWSVLMLPFSIWPGGSVSYLLDMYFKTLVVFWLIGAVINTLPRLRKVIWALCLMSAPLALASISSFFSGEFISEQINRVGGYNAPLTNNPNDLALMLNLLLPLCVALFFSSRRGIVRLLLGLIIGLDILAIFTTFSRGGFLTLGVILLAYIWLPGRRPERIWAWMLLLAGLLAVPFAPSDYADRIGTITNIEADQTGSAQERLVDLLAAARYVAEHPVIGSGIGMNILALNEQRGDTWTAIHNVYLQYGVELGLPGMLLFLLLLRASYRKVAGIVKGYRYRPQLSEFFYLAEGIRISLIAFAFAAFFYPVGYHFYFYLIAGLAVAAGSIGRTVQDPSTNDVATSGLPSGGRN